MACEPAESRNRELEAFSYSVSHDLRGPLRAIAGFTGLLRDRHYETIDADGRRCIDRVLAGTQRKSNLIDDLPELGRVTRVEIRRRQVDLSACARAIRARLQEARRAAAWRAHLDGRRQERRFTSPLPRGSNERALHPAGRGQPG